MQPTTESTMKKNEGSLTSKDGLKIYYQSWLPTTPKGLVMIVHGVGEHSGRYRHPIHFMVPKGWGFYGLDHRGHGRSQGKRGHVMNWSDFLDDLGLLLQQMKQDFPDLPIFILGHSMGGLVALSYALRHPQGLAGIAVSSPQLGLRLAVPVVKAIAGQVLSRVWPSLTLANEIDVTHITRDAEEVKLYQQDPLVHNRVSARSYTEMLAAMDMAFVKAPTMQIPCLMQVAGGDLIVDPQASQHFYDRLPEGQKRFISYEGFYHEIFNDPERDRVLTDLHNWLEQQLVYK